jgi:hypothetical protein
MWFKPQTIEEAKAHAEILVKSSLCPAKRVEDVLVIAAAGAELGVGFYAAQRLFHTLHGSLVPSAALIVGLAKKHAECLYFKEIETTDVQSLFETKRKGDPEPTRAEYTLAEAKRAGLTRNATWSRHTRAMLRARAASTLARMVYPDALGSLVADDQIDDDEPQIQPAPLSKGTVPMPLRSVEPEKRSAPPSAPPYDAAMSKSSRQWCERWCAEHSAALVEWMAHVDTLSTERLADIAGQTIASFTDAVAESVTAQIEAKARMNAEAEDIEEDLALARAWASAELYYLGVAHRARAAS